MWPSDYPFIMFTLSGILIPAGLCIGITIYQADPNIVDENTKIGLIGFYVLSVFISLYCLFQVATTEPGILPSVYMNSGIPATDRHKADSVQDYYCEYNSKSEVAQTMEELNVKNPAHQFYHLNKFSYLQPARNDQGQIVPIDKKHRQNKLSYCNICDMLRPPRSFHCSQCGVCIEAHDHHCPWVGTCIGYRNVKYFIAFLFWTAILAMTTVGICVTIMVTCYDQINDEAQFTYSSITKTLLIYGSLVTFCLFCFFLHQYCSLGLKNITSNEDIRHRWNGNHKNWRHVKSSIKQTGCCSRSGYLFCGNVDRVHGKSKLLVYSELVENFYQLQILQQRRKDREEDDEAATLLDRTLTDNLQIQVKLKLHRWYMRQLNNINVLRNTYGIDISCSDLFHYDVDQRDQDLLELYLEQKERLMTDGYEERSNSILNY